MRHNAGHSSVQLQLQQVQGIFTVVITAAATRFRERRTVDQNLYIWFRILFAYSGVQNSVCLIWGSGPKIPLKVS